MSVMRNVKSLTGSERSTRSQTTFTGASSPLGKTTLMSVSCIRPSPQPLLVGRRQVDVPAPLIRIDAVGVASVEAPLLRTQEVAEIVLCGDIVESGDLLSIPVAELARDLERHLRVAEWRRLTDKIGAARI